jgi:hypothetical protein
MLTSDLIRAIAADASRPGIPLGQAWRIAVLAAILLAATVFLAALGPRHDIVQALHTIRFPFKFVVTLTLATCTVPLVIALATPGATLARRLPLLLLAPGLLAAAMAAELLVVPSSQWMARTIGTNSLYCLGMIPLIGAAPLAAFLLTLRHGAPTRPGIAGAAAGLLAGALSATFYAAHCTDDSPLFVAVWYSLAIAILAALGAIAAPRLARW